MERNVVVSRRRKTETTAAKIEGFDVLPADSEEAHVLAVDDSLVDRKVIERLLKISSFKGDQKFRTSHSFFLFFFVSIFGCVYTDFSTVWKCAVTAVDSGRRALQFLGLDEEKTSSVGFDVRMNYIFKQFSVYFMYIWVS